MIYLVLFNRFTTFRKSGVKNLKSSVKNLKSSVKNFFKVV